jgi:aryl-alcohol dehydrogenase-like predicted oxidoreductase
MNDDSVIRSAEEWVEMLDEIQAKAAEVGVEIEAEVEADLEAYRVFFATASQRSDTMVDYVLNLVETQPGKPVAMIIGAAHTERVAELLEDGGCPLPCYELTL